MVYIKRLKVSHSFNLKQNASLLSVEFNKVFLSLRLYEQNMKTNLRLLQSPFFTNLK